MKPHSILMLVKLPPPHTGAAVMNQLAVEKISTAYPTQVLDLSYKQGVDGLGSFSMRKLLLTLKNYFKLVYYLIRFKPTLVYFQISPLGFAFLRDFLHVLIIKVFRIKLLYHLHGMGIREASLNSSLFKALYHFSFKNEHVITLSEKLIYDIETVYEPPVFILPNSIRANEAELKSYPREYDVLFLSNLLVSKGLIVFLEALQILKESGSILNAVIVGNEGDISKIELEKELVIRGLSDNCRYVGPLYESSKFETIARSKLLVFPTLNDVWGLVIIEAFSQKTPVIASDEGAISDMVQNNITGRLVSKNSVESLVEAISFCLSNPELCEKWGEAAFELYNASFSEQVFSRRLLEIVQLCHKP